MLILLDLRAKKIKGRGCIPKFGVNPNELIFFHAEQAGTGDML